MQTIYLDISNKGNVTTINAKQGDVGRKFRAIITENGVVPTIVDVETSEFSVWYSGASGNGNYKKIGDRSAFYTEYNTVVVELIHQMLKVPGKGELSLSMEYGGDQIGLWNIPYDVEAKPGADSETATDYFDDLANAQQKAEEAADRAEAAADRAESAGGGGSADAVTYTPQDLTEEQKAQARENIGITADPNIHAKYFDIDYHGIISLKSEYAQDGDNADKLPENIILPEVVNKMAVLGLADGMFSGDWRVKSVTFPSTVDVIPNEFCADAGTLRHVYNTEHITTVNYRGFRNSGITKALFPNLKEIGTGVFAQCPLLHIVDIGNEITTIPSATFGNSKFLSCVKGGRSVKTLEASAFQGTRNLTSVPFMSQITSMGNAAFLGSRIQYDWESIKSSWEASKNATPIQDNTTDYWSGYIPKDCENPLTSMLCQKDPRWADTNYGTTTDPYSSGCGVMVALHIHSAITGKEYGNPKEFEADISALDNGADLLATVIDDVGKLVSLLNSLGAVSGYIATAHTGTITAEIYQNMCEKLNAGAYVAVTTSTSASRPNDGHIVALYGINKYGEVLYLDSDNGNQRVGVYDDFFTGALPFQNFTGPDSDIIIVEKP